MAYRLLYFKDMRSSILKFGYVKAILGVLVCGGLAGLSLNVQAQVLTYVESSFWHPRKQFQGILLTEVNSFSYASSNPKGRTFEMRFHARAQIDQKLKNFRFYFLGSIWGQIPQETSYSLIDIESTFMEWKSFEKMSEFSIQVGRVLPDWGSPHHMSPIRQVFPSFSLDPFESHPSGMLGFYGKIQENRLDFEILGSPIFIPNMGGALYEINDQKKLVSPSRWVLPIYNSAKVGTARIPLSYAITIPKVKNVIFQGGGAARLTFKDFYEQYRFSASVFHVMDPKPRFKMNGQLTIADKIQNFNGQVDIIPEFYRQTIYALEGHMKGHGADMHFETSYRDPQNPPGLREDLVSPEEWKNFIALQTKHGKFLWPQALIGFSLIRQWNPYKDPNYKLPAPPLNNLIGRLDWKPFALISFFTSSEISTSLNESLSRLGASFEPFRKASLGAGIDFVSGKDNTYWGYLRDNDRLWLRGTYEF